MKHQKQIKHKSEAGKIRAKLDSLFRKIILLERGEKCEWCRKEGVTVQISHVLPKGRYSKLRYKRENVLVLCVGCHLFGWHKDILKANKWLDEYKGKDFFNQLMVLDKIEPKHTLTHLNILKFAMEKELEVLQVIPQKVNYYFENGIQFTERG